MIVEKLNEKQIGHMIHALGISYPGRDGKLLVPGKRHKPLPVAYRNYYQVDFCEEWEDLVAKGMAVEGTSLNLHYYFVTKKGVSYIRELGYLFKDGE